MSAFSSLVADYGNTSSSSGSESDSESESENDSNAIRNDQEENASKLPPPEFGSGSHLSVFSNPFAEAENAKKAILEKHVKMTPTKEETTMINGKRICWNYRKGRCRFGHNCKFAHDSDLHKSDAAEDNMPEQIVLAQNSPATGAAVLLEPLDKVDDDETIRKKKKRPGLGDNIVPGKKVMKMYNKQHKSAVN